MEIYKIKSSPESIRYGLMARDVEGYCYVYSANTSLWHRSKDRELDLVFTREAVYEPISSEAARELLPGVRPAGPGIMEGYVSQLEAQEDRWTRSSIEVLSLGL